MLYKGNRVDDKSISVLSYFDYENLSESSLSKDYPKIQAKLDNSMIELHDVHFEMGLFNK